MAPIAAVTVVVLAPNTAFALGLGGQGEVRKDGPVKRSHLGEAVGARGAGWANGKESLNIGKGPGLTRKDHELVKKKGGEGDEVLGGKGLPSEAPLQQRK